VTGLLAVLTVLAPWATAGTNRSRCVRRRGRGSSRPGSTIAFDKVPATGTRAAPPVVLLHGGPGTPGSGPVGSATRSPHAASTSTPTTRSAPAGRRVCRTRPTTREPQRRRPRGRPPEIGAERLVLVGTSWGATLAAEYLAARPERVAGVVFVSPERCGRRPGREPRRATSGTACLRPWSVASTRSRPARG
jgi:proline iminopeptidase